jgi:hypothetical protein
MRALCIFVAHSQPTVSIAKTDFYVHPHWEIADALDDKGNRVKGTFKLDFIWPPLSNPNDMPAPRDVVHITNFATGSSGVRELASTPLQMSYGGSTLLAAATLYVGDFKQSFVEKCYPFDEKEVVWSIGLMSPGEDVYNMKLYCAGNEAYEGPTTSTNARYGTLLGGNADVTKCTQTLDSSGIGVKWASVVCTHTDDTSIDCTMKGLRNYQVPLKIFFLPAFIYISMSFSSFKLGIKMSMPRIATSVIALLNLSGLYTRLVSIMPQGGETSWMQESMLIGMCFMFVNFLFHVLAFWYDSEKKPWYADLVDDIALYVKLPLFVMTSMCLLHANSCVATVSEAFTGVLIAASILGMIAGGARCYYRHLQRRPEPAPAEHPLLDKHDLSDTVPGSPPKTMRSDEVWSDDHVVGRPDRPEDQSPKPLPHHWQSN